ncbi:MAG: gephyrin-like molybdotransferase Glp [Pseudomonadota bacterium]
MTSSAEPADRLNDCFLHDKDRLRHQEALSILKEGLAPLGRTETVPLSNATGRIIAEAISAPRDVPLTDNAAVDGYAFAHSSLGDQPTILPVVERIVAGETSSIALSPGNAARIFTGASMPSGADTVAMQEDCKKTSDGSGVVIPSALKKGANCRKAGEDVKEGTPLFASGSLIRPQDIAALASLGKDQVSVHEKVRVAALSTGDELVPPGAPISPGQVYNSNGPLLESLLHHVPASVTVRGPVQDDPAVIRETLLDLAANHDLILTTGGASLGEEDHILAVLDEIGERRMWQLAIKPGRPMTFGMIGNARFIGLPGNPVAAFVCYLLYARPVLLRLAGKDWDDPLHFVLPAAFSMKKKTDRREFLRGVLTMRDGVLHAGKFGRDGSGLITGLREADGLIEVAEDVSNITEGDPVSFVPFSSFGI